MRCVDAARPGHAGGGRAPGIVPDPAMMNLHGTRQAGQSLPYVRNVMNDMQNVRHDLCADNPRFYALSALAELRGCHVTLQPDTHGANGAFSGRLIPRRGRYHPSVPARPSCRSGIPEPVGRTFPSTVTVHSHVRFPVPQPFPLDDPAERAGSPAGAGLVARPGHAAADGRCGRRQAAVRFLCAVPQARRDPAGSRCHGLGSAAARRPVDPGRPFAVRAHLFGHPGAGQGARGGQVAGHEGAAGGLDRP